MTYGVIIPDWVAVEDANIDEVNDNTGAFDVAEEIVAESLALMGTFDQAGDVGDDERIVVAAIDDAEVRFEGGERIVGYLGNAS